MQRQRVRPGAQVQQQAVGRLAQLGAGRVQRLPLLGILVGANQQRFRRLGDFLGQAACGHFIDPFLLLLGLTLLFLQRGQRGGQDVGRGGAIAACRGGGNRRARRAAASAARPVRPAWGRGRNNRRPGRGIEFLLGRAFPQELQVQRLGGGAAWLISAAGSGAANVNSVLARLILLRLPDSDSTCRLASVSDRMLPALKLPSSS